MKELQNLVREMVEKCGFNEAMQDVLILFVEEVGELTHAVRQFTNLEVKSKEGDRKNNLEEELADCIILLLDIANLGNVNLEEAVKKKIKRNLERKWE